MSSHKSFVITLENDFFPLEHHKSDHQLKRGAFISRGLDSLENGTVWHRCKINYHLPPDTRVYISYFASDRETVTFQGQQQKLDEVIRSPQVDSKEKEALLAGYWQEVIVDGADFLLHSARGRFIWYKIEYISYGGEHPQIKDIQVDFPLQPLTNYLPEIYQEEQSSADLLNRFLGIFQSLLGDLDKTIEDVSRYLDLDLVDGEFLRWLCTWLQVNNSEIWPEEKLRLLLRQAYPLYQIKGTRESIERVVELYTGEKPFIVEYHSIAGYRSRLYERLYGDNPYIFTVMVKEHSLPTTQHYLELKQVVDSFKPAYTILNLVALRSYMLLDSYVYLGVNSELSGSTNLFLDDKAMIPYDTTLEGMEDG